MMSIFTIYFTFYINCRSWARKSFLLMDPCVNDGKRAKGFPILSMIVLCSAGYVQGLFTFVKLGKQWGNACFRSTVVICRMFGWRKIEWRIYRILFITHIYIGTSFLTASTTH